MPFSANVKILKRRLHGRPLFTGKVSRPCALGNHAQYVEEALNPAMAVRQHANARAVTKVTAAAIATR